jgi:SAM-dependent methyltransferase
MIRKEPFGGVIDRSLNYGRANMAASLGRAAAAGPVKTVLDIGAGKGDDLLLARKASPAAALHAVELYPPYQEALRAKGITVHPLNIERDPFPFGDGAVDVVMANQILEHVKEIFWVLHEASRVLREGGSLLVGVPNLAAFHNRLLLLAGRQPTCLQNQSAHVRGYTKHDLLALLEGPFPGGYALAEFSGSNFYPFPAALARPLAAAFPSMAWSIFLRFEKRRPYAGEFLTHPVRHQLETNFYLGEGR